MRGHWIGAFTCFLCLTSFLAGKAPAGPPVQDSEPCPAADPRIQAVLEEADILLFGEIHGSREVPAFIQAVVCSALELPRPVILALEIFSSEQQRIDAFLRSSGNREAKEALIQGAFWQREQQDGRSSQAMLELLDAARILIQAERKLSVHCFDAPTEGAGDTRDHSMARSLLAERKLHAEARMVVLTGNVHARKTIGTGWNPDLKPTGWYLSQSPERMLSLNLRNAPGSFWACTPECGIQNLGGRGDARARGIEIEANPGQQGYDGVFDIGVPTASLPAKN